MKAKPFTPTLDISQVVPTGLLRTLKANQLVPSRNNPRHLFDPEPLKELKENIRQHGVLVPLTVYQQKGQTKFAILDGARRHRCCVELNKEGLDLDIPANVVDPPTKIAGLLYMFSIHNFREPWELMPTALSLEIVMKELGKEDNDALSELTGLGSAQIERCKKLLSFPKRFQNLSLDPEPGVRIPSNFWIEAYPVLDLCEEQLPDLRDELGRWGITDRFVEKYRAKSIKSVIHFRRIMEAYESADGQRQTVLEKLRSYIKTTELETRATFDEFVMPARKIQGVINACADFVDHLKRLKLEHTLDKEEVTQALRNTKEYIQLLLNQLKGSDPPANIQDSDDED